LRNLLGNRTAAGITRDIASGDIFNRASNESQRWVAQYARNGKSEDGKKALREFLQGMDTDVLDQVIALRYEAGASQAEINLLEDVYADRVSEEDQPSDYEPDIFDEVSVEEQLSEMYHRYITPNRRSGMDEEGIISNMRAAVQNARGYENLTDENLLAAAKDAYENKARIRSNRNVQYAPRPERLSLGWVP